ncbi:MAG TPA: TlpA disulfide reductase family protein [Chthoniobacteraceae bacterium]|nr:TlpA disulfide reductase family protein [Chthoniobacteraceae bacterium]
MKTRLILPLLILGLAAHAADKKQPEKTAPPAAEKADDLSPYKSADDLWKHIEELRKEPTVQPKSREEFMAIVKKWFGEQKAAADLFMKNYASDPRHYSAQLISIQASMQLSRIPGADASVKADPEEQRKQIDAIIAAPDAPEEAKGEASFVRAILLTGQLDSEKPETISAFLKSADDFLAKYGSHKLAPQMRQVELQVVADANTPEAEAVLEKLAKSDDARIAEMAKSSLAKREKMKSFKTKPVELKFTATDGKEVDLEKLRGKVVLVDFWASWCGPCMAEAPNVVATYKKLHEKGFEILGISLDQDKAAMEGALKKHGMTWQQFFDGKGWQNSISTSFGINSIPAAWLIDKKGMLRETSLRGEALGAGVEKLLAE